MNPAHRIVIASGKGGAGKTTTALNLAVALAETGRRVLLVDLDPQGGIGLALARRDTEWMGLAEHLVGQAPLDSVLFQTKLPELTILPRGRLDPVNVADYELRLSEKQRLGEMLGAVESGFDYVMMDAPSGLGLVPRAALRCSHSVLIPVQAEPMALRAVSQIFRVVEHVVEHENSALQVLGLLPSMVDLRDDASFEVTGNIWSELSGVFVTHVPRSKDFARASQRGLPVGFLGGLRPPEAGRFEMLANEVNQRVAARRGAKETGDERPERSLV
ncbi:MAG: ParA family protein [Myxococcota bacterium]